MKKISLAFICITGLSYCTKEEAPQNPVVIYELESNTDAPFIEIKYGSGAGGATKEWKVSGIGIHQKADTIKKGTAVFLEARNAGSDKWKIRIRTTDESFLIEGPVKFQSGTPGYYYSSISGTFN
ncbi:hypothetical protein ACTJJ0_08085 [Chitinophaga sp. 22321]|uniref:Lipoprotein n=1 Tax=Chitinophaga hostae TaxID=2831022 RepID=A0ABS5ITM9_9BACT|nr:hypothetical protein [Chitinophaga hostae]MBS0026318.1 hypothetical protein [Chitinophaga hostae]